MNDKKIEYIVAIPSYKRYHEIYSKSIQTLLNGGVHYTKIYIFVANKDEKEKYVDSLKQYGKCYSKIIVGKLGINNQRKFIIKYFEEGTNVVFMDDDVETIEKLNIETEKLNMVKNLHTLICDAFFECIEKDIFLWGIYPVRNVFFMKPRPEKSYGLRFILGTFYGQRIRHSKDLITGVAEKEDVENSILHYKKDCGVLRLERIALKTKFYNPKGGICAMTKDRKKIHEKSAKQLEKKYGEYGNIWIRGNGTYEFKLKNLPYKC